MAPVVTSAEIDRPAAEVFAYATDPARPGHGIGTILVPLMVRREHANSFQPRWWTRRRQRRSGTPLTPRAMTRTAGTKNIRTCRCGCSALPGSRPLMPS